MGEHWFFADDGTERDAKWRRTTLVGYGTFDSDGPVPDAMSSHSTGQDLHISSGCGNTSKLADWALADSKTLDVVFAGHYLGGWMTGWHKGNQYGAQEEKFGTLVPEMMLATEPLRHMGAGLLSAGVEDPWLPEAGWYIIGAGTYVKSKGYPFWTPAKVPLQDKQDYFNWGTAAACDVAAWLRSSASHATTEGVAIPTPTTRSSSATTGRSRTAICTPLPSPTYGASLAGLSA